MTDIPAGPRFPEQELEGIARFFEIRARQFAPAEGEGAKEIVRQSEYAAGVVRDALQSHADMRERLLGQIAELRGQLGQRSAAA